MMNITFLGTGSAFNHEDGNNSALLQFSNTNLLLDCGYDVPQKLEKIINLSELKNIWISHIHADHCSGLEEIAFKSYFLLKQKINLIIHEDLYEELISMLNYPLKYNDSKVMTVEDYFNVICVKKFFKIKEEKFEIEKTNHIKNMQSFMLKGNNFIFTGDTKFIDWTKQDLSAVDYIFHDTQLVQYGQDVHSTLPQMKELPEEIRKKIWCMHYNVNINDYKKELSDFGFNIVEKFKTIKLDK